MVKTSDYGLSKNSKNQQGFHGSSNFKGNLRRGNDGTYSKNNQGYRGEKRTEVTAPYNFVPLNTTLLASHLEQYVKDIKDVNCIQEEFARYIREQGKFSGYVMLNVETLTPLYIEKDGRAYSDGDNYCIPGSSMRGAIKNLFKIVTNSSLRSDYKAHDSDVTDRHLYYRSFASPNHEFRDLYIDRVNPDRTGRKTKPGFLVRKGEFYTIYEASCEEIPTKTTEEANWRVPNKTDKKGNPIYKPHIIWRSDCTYVYTGPFVNKSGEEDRSKKHYYKVYNPQWEKKHILSQRIVKEYEKDKSRGRLNLLNEKGWDKAGLLKRDVEAKNIRFLLNRLQQFDFIVPCFYIEEDNEVTGFGAGPYFRIPYRKSISDHILKDVNQKSVVDYTDAVFGSKEYWSSRVFFEDLYLVENSRDCLLEPASQVKILEGPKPTSFQNYLVPASEAEASTWESDSLIRGYKLYWHHEKNRDTDWKWKSEKNVPSTYEHKIEPVKAGRHFVGRIRFENLSETELGALLFVLGLGNEQQPMLKDQNKQYVTFKMGMGKPIGLGSIAVTSELFIASDDYYTSLFSTDEKNCFNLPQAVQSGIHEGTGCINKYVELFIDTMKQAGSYNAEYLHRIGELKMILDASYRTKMPEKIRYLDVNNRADKDLINQRKPLPSITEVKNSLC